MSTEYIAANNRLNCWVKKNLYIYFFVYKIRIWQNYSRWTYAIIFCLFKKIERYGKKTVVINYHSRPNTQSNHKRNRKRTKKKQQPTCFLTDKKTNILTSCKKATKYMKRFTIISLVMFSTIQKQMEKKQKKQTNQKHIYVHPLCYNTDPALVTALSDGTKVYIKSIFTVWPGPAPCGCRAWVWKVLNIQQYWRAWLSRV